jgi:hypothetical protein
VIFRLLAMFMWATASLSAQAEGVWAHALADVLPNLVTACAASIDEDPATHCASACLATSAVAVRTADAVAAPQPNDPFPTPPTIPTLIAFEPALLPPVRAGPWIDAPLQIAYLRDLGSVRLLI